MLLPTPKTAFLLPAHKRISFCSSTEIIKTSESVQRVLLQNIIWFQLQRQQTVFFLKIRSRHKNIQPGLALLRFIPTSLSPTQYYSLLRFSSLLWSFLPGYLFNLDHKLCEEKASILRGLKSIIANLGHSIKELFINKALLQDGSNLSVMTLTSMQHIPCMVLQLHCPRKQGTNHEILTLRIQCV